jgi:CheY-like chemotaxis protein
METIDSSVHSIAIVPPKGPEHLRVLMIDDDETDRASVRRYLRQSGLSVIVDEAASAAEALTLIDGARYDCVLLDYFLSDMDGLALLKTLRTVIPDSPVLIFTGRGDEDMAVELMKAGASDYLPKNSMSAERLSAGLRYAMELARATKARREAEDKLRTQEAQFRTLANAIPQMAWMTDPAAAVIGSIKDGSNTPAPPSRTCKVGGGARFTTLTMSSALSSLSRAVAPRASREITHPLRGKDGATDGSYPGPFIEGPMGRSPAGSAQTQMSRIRRA